MSRVSFVVIDVCLHLCDIVPLVYLLISCKKNNLNIEFGSPRDLCNRPAGMFRALVERSGISTAAEDGDRDGASLLGPASHLDL